MNLYFKENSVIYVPRNYFYAINITQFNILTYSDIDVTPRNATLIFTDAEVSALSLKTRYNFIAGMSLNSLAQISTNTLTEREKTQLQTINVGFMIGRSGFKIDNVHIKTDFTNANQAFTLFKAVYQQSKLIEITNSQFNITGNLFESLDPLNLQVSNLDVDYFTTRRGFYILSS